MRDGIEQLLPHAVLEHSQMISIFSDPSLPANNVACFELMLMQLTSWCMMAVVFGISSRLEAGRSIA